jgi:hypothetical protein
MYKSLSKNIRGVINEGKQRNVLNCLGVTQVLPDNVIERHLLEIKRLSNVNNSKLYIGEERIAETNQGIQYQYLEEDGGYFKQASISGLYIQ